MSEENKNINDLTPSETPVSEGDSSLDGNIERTNNQPKPEYACIGDVITAISVKHLIAGKGELRADKAFASIAPRFEQLLENLLADPAWAHIKHIDGKKDTYYYCGNLMTDQYANIISLVRDDDISRTITEMVRHNAKFFPFPTAEDYFYKHPYRYSEAIMRASRINIKRNPSYADIIFFTVKNADGEDVPYISSTLHLSENYARVLAESNENQEP